MKRFYWLLYLLALVFAQPATAQDMVRVRQTIDTLASPYFHGRGYIRQGDTRAASYLKNQFQQAGLQPFNNSYFQCFSLQVNTITHTPKLRINGKPLKAGTDFVARASSATGKGNFGVLYLDSLTLNTPKKAQQFFSQNLTGKAVVLKQSLERQLSKPQQQLLRQAGLLIILQPTSLLTTIAMQQSDAPVLEVLENAWPTAAQEVEFSIKSKLVPRHNANNVISYIKGTTQPDSFLVFTAHYDHLGGQGQDVYFPGANDNASGTAMLLELARHYTKPENRPAYSIAFIAFAAEEAGLIGSNYYVANPLFPLAQIKFLTNLDLLGTGDNGLMVVNGKIHDMEFALLQTLNEQHKLLPQIKSRGKAANSDHYPFSEKGVPSFFLYTLGGTAAYHNTSDHAEQLPLTKFKEVFRLITLFTDNLQ